MPLCPLAGILAILSGTASAAEQDAPPCAVCVVLAVAPGDAAAIASDDAHLEGLPIIVSASAMDEAARAAIDRLRRAGAVVGLELPLAALSSIEPRQIPAVALVILDARQAGALGDEPRYALRTFATAVRAARADAQLGLDVLPDQMADPSMASLGAYFDFVVSTTAADGLIASRFPGMEIWTAAASPASTIADLVAAPRLVESNHTIARLAAGRERLAATIAELRSILPGGLTPLPEVTVTCDSGCDAAAYLHPQTLEAVALVRPNAPVTRVRVAPTATGLIVYADVKTDRPGAQIDLPATDAPFVLRIRGWRGSTEEAFASDVQVSGARQLRVDEIVARHQAARARQDAIVRTVIAEGSTVLTFQVPGFAAPFTISAATRVFSRAGETTVEQTRIRVNGLEIARNPKDVPRLPLLEPERVSTPPLTIALTEAYRYELRGRDRIGGRDAYVVAFEPRLANRALFAGRAWIDAETFGVVKTDAAQTALRGPIAASRQVDEFERADIGTAAVWLLRRSEIFQIYTGPSESTPIHRVVSFDRHAVNGADFDAQLDAALRSTAVMLRDTTQGYRFLLPDASAANGGVRRLSPSNVDRVTTAVVGGLFDPNISVPLVFAGVSYVDFNLFNTGTQLNAFFGGTYGRFSWSTPPLFGAWRLTGDGAGVALSYNDRAFRGGVERYEENVRQRPAQLSLALLGSIAPALRIRAGYEMSYTRYTAAASTAASFVVPASTPVHAARLAVEAERGPVSATAWISIARRQNWTPWGLAPSPAQRDERRFERFGATVGRSIVWSPRAVGRVETAFTSGHRLDRFSRFAFGSFDNPLRGYPSVSIRYDNGMAVRSAATWTPASHVRVDGFADLGIVRQPDDSRVRAFPGVGAAIETPAPFGWLAAVEWGYGLKGMNTDGTIGTHVIRVSGYKVF